MSEETGKLVSEKITRRFVLQLQVYFKNQDMRHGAFLELLGVTAYAWHSWTTGKVKRIRMKTLKSIAQRLQMDMSSILGVVPAKGEGRFTHFIEFNELYRGLLYKGDTRSMMQILRKAAMTCYDAMVDEKLPVILSITNVVDKNILSDDLICLDCKHENNTYRLQIVPGLQISYCFGVVNGVLGQKVLHEGVLSMSIMLVICEYIRSKLSAPEAETPDDGAYFVNFSREFAKKISD